MFGFKALPRTLAAAGRDLYDAKAPVRKSAIVDLVRLASGEERELAIGHLADALGKHTDPETRADAAIALADVGAVDHVTALLDATYERHPRLRQMALLGLGELASTGDGRVERVVTQALTASEPALRFQALIAAGRIVLSDLVVRLESALGDGDPALRYLALRLVDEHWERCRERSSLLRRASSLLDDADAQVRVAAALLPFAELPDGATGNASSKAAGLTDAERAERVKQVLVQALDSRLRLPAPEDEQAVIERVAELELGAAVPALRRIAWGLFGLAPGAFAYQARVALLRMGDDAATRHFKKALGSRRADVCAQAVAAVTEAKALSLLPELDLLERSGRVDNELIMRARDALAGDARVQQTDK